MLIINKSFEDYKKQINLNDSIQLLVEDSPHIKRVGKSKEGIYQIIFSQRFEENYFSLMDAITFNETLGKNIILDVKEDYLWQARKVYEGHGFDDAIRPYESEYIIHSTDESSYKSIMRDGKLKSFNSLHFDDKDAELAIGKLLGDPDTLRDYILFSPSKYPPEIVVASKEYGRIIQNIDVSYHPGVRMYFDSVKMAQDKILIRDGLHYMVKDELDLEDYLLLYVDVEKLNISKEVKIRDFANNADFYFYSFLKNRGQC